MNFGDFPDGPVVKPSLPTQGYVGLIPGQGTKIPCAMGCGQKKKKKKKTAKKNTMCFLKNGFWEQHKHSAHRKG